MGNLRMRLPMAVNDWRQNRFAETGRRMFDHDKIHFDWRGHLAERGAEAVGSHALRSILGTAGI
jgi:hypothetical protein